MRAARFTADDSNLSRSDRDEIFWALAYRLELWTAIERSGQTSISADESGPIIQRCIDDLTKIQLRSGSWFHEYANSFVTATGVLSLHEASELSGNARSKSALSSAVASLSRQRHLSGAFPYDESAQSTKYPPTVPASAGRMPLCEAAIFLGGKSSVVRLQYAIESSFQNHRALDVAYKYDDHTDARNFSYGGFFFWFDMRGRKQAIDLLPESPTKTKFAQQLEAIVISKSEIDGCYVDSHEIGRCYGSAMALLCLEK